jgi:hypothetical protein
MSVRACAVSLAVASLLACEPEDAGRKPRVGTVAITADLETCPTVLGIEALPLEVMLGNDVQLRARVDDPDAAIEWHALGGTLRDRAAHATVYRCEQPGLQPISLRATGEGCRGRASVRVTCSAVAIAGSGG